MESCVGSGSALVSLPLGLKVERSRSDRVELNVRDERRFGGLNCLLPGVVD